MVELEKIERNNNGLSKIIFIKNSSYEQALKHTYTHMYAHRKLIYTANAEK